MPLFNHLPFDPVKESFQFRIGYFTCDFIVNTSTAFKRSGDFLESRARETRTLNVGTVTVADAKSHGRII